VWPVLRPGALLKVEALLDRYRPRGLRLLPNYHGYRLSDESVERIMRLARDRNMIVQVFQRIADERWHYLLKTPPVAMDDLQYFTARYGDQRLLLSGLGAFGPIAARVDQAESIYLDTSRIRGPQFGMETLHKDVRFDRIVFGSLWPIQMIEASLWQIGAARIDESIKRAYLHDNAASLLSGAGRQ